MSKRVAWKVIVQFSNDRRWFDYPCDTKKEAVTLANKFKADNYDEFDIIAVSREQDGVETFIETLTQAEKLGY